MRKYNWNWYKRKFTWIGNVMISLPLRLSRPFRNKNIWVFACWEGKRYDDNSKYLYEYVNEYHPEIQCIWISRDTTIVNSLIRENKKAFLSHSKAGIKSMLCAGAAFYTNGLDDFSNICLLYGSKIVCLNHGNTGIKKAAYTLEKFKKNSFVKHFKLFRDKLFNYYYYDLCVTTSKISSNLFCELYGDLDKRKYIITGMPRNDILLNYDLFKIKKPSIFEKDYKYILYLPTYREYKNTIVKDLLEYLMNDYDFLMMMEKKKVKFLIKPHNIDGTNPLIEIKNDNFKFVKSNEIESTQILMAYSDCLITDYSSCSIDFALTGKPVLFYIPDFDLYNKNNGFRALWMDFYNKHPEYRKIRMLKHQLIAYFNNNIFDETANRWINSIYLGHEINDTVYSENVYKRIKKELGDI